MKIRILLAYLVAALVQGCALMPPPADQPAGVGGRTIELPSPPGLVSTPVDHPGTAVRNAQLKAESKRPLRHFLRHDDYARTRSGLAPRHSQEGYAAVIADLQTTTFGRDVIDELKAQIEADIAAGPDQERDPPDPEQVAALHQTVDPNLTIERISIEPTALTLTDHGPDHVCSLMVTRQETTVSAIPYYTFSSTTAARASAGTSAGRSYGGG